MAAMSTPRIRPGRNGTSPLADAAAKTRLPPSTIPTPPPPGVGVVCEDRALGVWITPRCCALARTRAAATKAAMAATATRPRCSSMRAFYGPHAPGTIGLLRLAGLFRLGLVIPPHVREADRIEWQLVGVAEAIPVGDALILVGVAG